MNKCAMPKKTTSITIKHSKSERMWPNWVLKTGSHDHIQGTETVALTHYLMQGGVFVNC